MAVTLLTTGEHAHYAGLSSDARPVAADGVPQGATLYELDKRRTFVFVGQAWHLREEGTASGDVVALLAAILDELREIRHLTTVGLVSQE